MPTTPLTYSTYVSSRIIEDSHSYKGASCKATYYYIRTQKPKPDHCDRCGILETEIGSTIKSPSIRNSNNFPFEIISYPHFLIT